MEELSIELEVNVDKWKSQCKLSCNQCPFKCSTQAQFSKHLSRAHGTSRGEEGVGEEGMFTCVNLVYHTCAIRGCRVLLNADSVTSHMKRQHGTTVEDYFDQHVKKTSFDVTQLKEWLSSRKDEKIDELKAGEDDSAPVAPAVATKEESHDDSEVSFKQSPKKLLENFVDPTSPIQGCRVLLNADSVKSHLKRQHGTTVEEYVDQHAKKTSFDFTQFKEWPSSQADEKIAELKTGEDYSAPVAPEEDSEDDSEVSFKQSPKTLLEILSKEENQLCNIILPKHCKNASQQPEDTATALEKVPDWDLFFPKKPASTNLADLDQIDYIDLADFGISDEVFFSLLNHV